MRVLIVFAVASVVCADEFEVKKAALRLERANSILEEAQADHAEAERMARAGVVAQEQVGDARLRVDEAQAATDLRALEYEETKATGKPADDRISAPLVGKTDFAGKRLQVKHRVFQVRVDAAALSAARWQKLAKASAAGELALVEAKADLNYRVAEADLARKLIDVRVQFLAGKVAGPKAELLGSRHEAVVLTVITQVSMKVLIARAEGAKADVEAGRAKLARVRRILAEMDQVRAEYEIARLDVAQIDKKLADLGGAKRANYKTTEALARAAFGFLKSGDLEGFMGLAPTESDVEWMYEQTRKADAEAEAYFEQNGGVAGVTKILRESMRKSFTKARRESAAWLPDAKFGSVNEANPKKRDGLMQSDVWFMATVGEKVARIQLEDCILLPSGWIVIDEIDVKELK